VIDEPKPNSRTGQSDEELAGHRRRGVSVDPKAFETLVNRYGRHVLANCRHLTRSHHDAEDLAQEVFVKAYLGLPRYQGRATFRTWLQRIKINHCLNYLKSRDGARFVDLEDSSVHRARSLHVEPCVERDVMSMEGRERVSRALDGLPNTLRIPLVLRDVDGLTYEEIAESLGIGLSAVKMRIKRAREQFRIHYARGNGQVRKDES
jgi:RNA polymerase sigma-70 factor, ECF subfamily